MIKFSIRIAFCYLFLIGQVLAQTTAAILPQGKTQFLDNNGNPLSSGKVYFYIPNTTTFKTTWQDSAKTTANSNPVILDAGGRAIIYGDGTYRQQVRTSSNSLIYDVVTSSAGTGGGTTGTGDGDLVGTIKPWAGLTAPNQYAFTYGQEVSRTTYSVLFTAITLQQLSVTCVSGNPTVSGFSDTSQIPTGAIVESLCLPSGSTVVSKTATTVTFNNNATISTTDTFRIFLYGNGNGSTTFNLPDLRGQTVFARNNMGGTPSVYLSSTNFGTDPNSIGAHGGVQSRALATVNLPPYTPTGTVAYTPAGTIAYTPAGTITPSNYTPTGSLSGTIGVSITDPGHSHTTSSTNLSGTKANEADAGTAGAGYMNTGTLSTGSQATGLNSSNTTVNLASGTFTGNVQAFSFSGTPGTPIFTGTAGTPIFTGTAQGGLSSPVAIIPPGITLNYIIKITPDSNSADASGVTSIQGMTGDIACGTGMSCTGNIISSTANAPLVINAMLSPYNATCNGVDSDTTAFNLAITAANSAGGGIVTVPDGKVCIIQSGTSINLKDNVYIKGNFTLKGTSATNNTEMILAISISNTGLIDITCDMINSFVEGNNNNACLSTSNSTSLLVQNINVINQANFGVLINGGTFRVLNNRMTMNSPYGVVGGIGRQNHGIQTACSFTSSGIINGNVLSGTSMNVCSQSTQITNNTINVYGYGSGIGHSGIGLPCNLKDVLGVTDSCGSLIAFNFISGGIGIDSSVFVQGGIESYDPQNVLMGNHIWNVAGTGIIGGAGTMVGNILHDNCMYYAVTTIAGGCNGILLRTDQGAGKNISITGNKVFNSFGAVLNVTGTTNSAGVIRITVADTSTVGPTNTDVPCRVDSVGGTTNANKGWLSCVVKSATSIELTGSVFNSAWTSGGTIGGLQDYSYSENSAALPNIVMSGNVFGPGFLGTYNILNTGTTSTEPHCAAPCTASNGALMVGLGGANLVWVPRAITGDWTMNSTGVATLTNTAVTPNPYGSATAVGTFTVNSKGLLTAAANVTITPAVGSITGLGTGVATALAVNTGSAGAFVLFNGALGTPSSGTLTNATGLPISSGVSGLGTGVATALATNIGIAGSFVVNGGALGSPSSAGTLPAHTLGGTVSGGGNQINNVIIGTVTPLAGTFTVLTATNTSTPLAANATTAGALTQVATFLGGGSMANTNKVMMVLGNSASSNNAFYQYYNHDSGEANRYWGVQAYEDGAGTGLNVFADSGVSVGVATSPGTGAFSATSFVKTGVTTFGALPACGASTKGARHFITDSNTAVFNANAAAGGANNIPVVCNGTNWVVG